MELNFTSIVQIGHFFIVYAILKRFLFKPLVAIVHQEDAAQLELEQAVQERRVLVIQRQQALQDQWEIDRARFAQLTPSISDLEQPPTHNITYEKKFRAVSKDEIKQIQRDIKEQLIKKVKRAH